jgi:phage terminase large subunit-like protein
VLMARHRKGCRAIEHCRAFRATPGKRDDLIVQTAQADGHGVVVGLEIEGGSGGLAQFHALEKRLKSMGYRVVGARPSSMTDREQRTMTRGSSNMSAKTSRADPVASCLERGFQRRGEGPDSGAPWHAQDAGKPLSDQTDGIRLFAGPWTADFLSIVEGFPDAATCDEVDAVSGAWAWLEAHPLGIRQPFGNISAQRKGVTHDLHPDDRPQQSSRWLTP